MPSITFHPLGNADCFRVDLAGGEKLLFDYADTRCAGDPNDKRIDLPTELRKDLDAARRDYFHVVAFTHLDQDHVCGAPSFFHLEHATKYQGAGRTKIRELWVPAFAICEERTDLCEDACIIQAEARYRLLKGEGIRVFSRPAALEAWLKKQGLTLASRTHLITDAGQMVPGWSKEAHGVEFFVHSPFAVRLDGSTLEDRNSNSLVFQATFLVDGRESRALLMADTEYANLAEIIRITKAHSREQRLMWDIVKLPHHCSYCSLGPEKGTDKTVPDPDVAWLYEKQGQRRGRIVSTSDSIPASGNQDQPPHRQAANYYRGLMPAIDGEFLVTMSHPSEAKPAPLEVIIDNFGVSVRKANRPIGAVATGMPAPRAG